MSRRSWSRTTRCAALAALLAIVSVLGAREAAAQQPTAAAQPRRPSARSLRRLRRRFEREPTVRETQKAALKFFRVHPELVSAYRAGAEWKALMPELEASFNFNRNQADRRLIDRLYANNAQLKDGKDFEFTNSDQYSVGVRARWYLDRLVFNAEVLDVASLVGVQEGLLREITSLYFTRRRLLTVFALNPPQDPAEQITENIRLDEITANLDALTGGYFSKAVKKALRGGG